MSDFSARRQRGLPIEMVTGLGYRVKNIDGFSHLTLTPCFPCSDDCTDHWIGVVVGRESRIHS